MYSVIQGFELKFAFRYIALMGAENEKNLIKSRE